MAERSPKNWDDPGNNSKKNLFIIYIIWVDGGYQGLVNSEGEKKRQSSESRMGVRANVTES